MDSKNSIIVRLQQLLSVATEEVLINLANKGTVNRGKKDLEKQREQIQIDMDEKDRIVVSIGTEAKVILTDQPVDCTCSCPSISFCRHIVTAICYAKEYSQYYSDAKVKVNTVTRSYTQEDFPELNQLLPSDIEKIVGKKVYPSLVLSLRKKNNAEFFYNEMLKVTLTAQNKVVYFPQYNSLKNAICSCKTKGICQHKAYALAAYLVFERSIDLPLEEENRELVNEEKEFLQQMQIQIAKWMDKGMSSLTDEVVKQTERQYIRAYGMQLYAIAEDLKWLSAEFAAYFSRNVSFSNVKTLHLCCRIYNRSSAILVGTGQQRGFLIGKKKEERYQLERLELWGLGAVPRLTKRQDILVSVYFYSPDTKEYYMLSTLRPSGNRIKELIAFLYNAGLFWSEEYSINHICSQKIILKNGVYTDGRISATKSSSAILNGNITLKELEQFALPSIKELRAQLEKYKYQYFDVHSEAHAVYLIKVQKVQKATYDAVHQCCRIIAIDKTEEVIELELQFSEVTKLAIEKLEKKGASERGTYILGNFYERNNKVFGILLNIMDSDCENKLYF